MNKQVDDILQYWFGDLKDGWASADKNALWFGARPEDDADMRERFGELVADASDGRLSDWQTASDASAMALLLLTDQMTRAIFRGKALAFAGDAVALAVCRAGVDSGQHLRLPPAWRRFFYLPLEHSEDMAHQRECVELFLQLQREHAGTGHDAELAENVRYARLHLDIIAQFGRFPHRNAVLGRQSTPDEERFLREKNLHFGQK